MSRRVPVIAIFVALAVFPVAALASWPSAGTGRGYSKATSMPAGNTPTASVSGRNVTVSWSASSGAQVAGYQVKRYNTSGTVQTIGSACSGTVTGTSCTENAVPAGSWRYSVTSANNNWRGAESAQSTAVTVSAAAMTLSPTTVTSLPATLTGQITNFISGQTVTFRLDNPTTGTVLSGSINPTPVPSNGTSNVTVTIPSGTSNGSHTVYAIGSQGDTASQAITVSAPTVSSVVIDKSTGCQSGFLKQGGSYFVYANVTGSPSSVTADVSSITTGQTAAAMTAGSFTVGGTTYNYRSASLTANASLAAGTLSYTVTATGGGSNSGTVSVDNTAPRASDVQTANKTGGIAGRPEAGDTMTLTYSETMDPCSISSGWDGSSALNVVVRIANVGTTDDTVTIWNATNTVQLPLGAVDVKGDVVSAAATFGATGTASTLTRSGATFTVTLGTASAGPRTDTSTTPMVWTPSTFAFDRAANANTTATATETGTADLNF